MTSRPLVTFASNETGGLEAAHALAGYAEPKTTLRAYARVQKGKTLRLVAVAWTVPWW